MMKFTTRYQHNAQSTAAHFAFWIQGSQSSYDDDAGLMKVAAIQLAAVRSDFLPRCSYVAPSLRSRDFSPQSEIKLTHCPV